MKKLSLMMQVISILGVLSFHSLAHSAEVCGHVADQKEGEPLLGTKVTVENSALSTRTDGQGDFCLEGLSKGRWNLVFEFIGYKTKKKIVQIRSQEERINLGTITLSVEKQHDEEVRVCAVCLDFERLIGRWINETEIEQTALRFKENGVLEILKKSKPPYVTGSKKILACEFFEKASGNTTRADMIMACRKSSKEAVRFYAIRPLNTKVDEIQIKEITSDKAPVTFRKQEP